MGIRLMCFCKSRGEDDWGCGITQCNLLAERVKTTTRTRWGIKSKNQLPLLMVWREYHRYGDVDFAIVLFNSMDWIGF
jgi:hypothetical protein